MIGFGMLYLRFDPHLMNCTLHWIINVVNLKKYFSNCVEDVLERDEFVQKAQLPSSTPTEVHKYYDMVGIWEKCT